MKKPKVKIEDRSVNQSDDMEIEIHSTKKGGSSLGDDKPNVFIGGPSSWDPYSVGVNVDELKASLASRAVAPPSEKLDTLPPEKPLFTVMDQSLGDADADAASSQETAGAGEQTNKAKTLNDAVKPKHKRKKKNLLNTGGS